MTTPIEEWRMQEYLSVGMGLVLADRAWTRWLGRSELTREEIGELAFIGQRTVLEPWTFLSSREQVEPMLYVLEGRLAAASEHWQAMAVPMEPSAPERLFTPVGFTQFAHSSFNNLMALHSEEADSIQRKVKNLEHGDWTPGDLSSQALCNLLGALSVTAACSGNMDLANYLLTLYLTAGCQIT
ncbi:MULTISPECIES: hypothetical protein [unclassified Streptomyces]|uniref:hypothetical protein n=1 Tax=unclassified Streptomyces TaxID=2593676 RepID=UPI0033AF039B